MALPSQKLMIDEEETDTGTPIRYLPLHHVYSTSSPCVNASGSSNVMSKKVKAQKLVESFDGDDDQLQQKKISSFRVYTRRGKKAAAEKPSLFDSTLVRVKSEPQREDILSENCGFEGNDCIKDRIDESGVKDVRVLSQKVRRRMGNNELVQLGVDSSVFQSLGSSRLRESRARNMSNGSTRTRKRKLSSEGIDLQKGFSGSAVRKRWFELSYKDVDPSTFIGLTCKVYWPLDDHWYSGSVTGFNPETKQHQVKYEDGDSESFTLSKEKIKFCLLREEMQRLNLRCSVTNKDNDGLDYSEMLVLAASFDDCEEPGPGDIIWGKLSGYAMWPAVVVNDSDVCALKGLQTNPGDKSVLVQFFGTHDFARISMKQVVSFLRGLLGSFHLKCSKPQFRRSLEEAKMYLGEQKLPNKMKQLRDGTQSDDSASGEDEETVCSGDDKKGIVGTRKVGCKTCPFEVGDLRVLNLGRIVEDSEYFHTERYIWPEGYTATRKFISVIDPSVNALYKMEVLRDPEAKFRPLFKVTLDNGEEFKGSTPSACWNKIYEELRETQDNLSNGFHGEVGSKRIDKSGSHMFGFSNPKVFKLIQELSYSRLFSISSACNLASDGYRDLPAGYRPVRVDWKDLDKCNVCYMDEEYENNVFLQCDKCRMMIVLLHDFTGSGQCHGAPVHARCYGELEPVDGILWLCNLCRPGAPKSPPPCCLCPVIGGAMKPTADGRWAHLACAIWIPETCLSDIKKMEPIDGINRISKDRWKLLCSICGVSYGACIQCSNSTCRVAYHPLCARAAGLCVELEDEDKLDIMSFDEEDDDDQCIRLFSFCKKHRQSSNERSTADEHFGPIAPHCSNYTPPINPSGCARSEPYDFIRRRGPKEPEALAAASLKRLFVENSPYLVSGSCQNGTLGDSFSSNELVQSRFSSKKLKISQLDTPNGVLSMAEKYKYMRATFRKRLAFGKSRIHGFGVFAKHPHRAGDMVIEYSGELVRLSIADKREHFIYNSLVGAGTYMFRIDDERVIDATKAGSIAHLINHSCKPNCFSRVISVHGDEHIIIFAKRDIKKWEELTYDYRFFSIDEQLACYCGFPKCRGVVNDIDTEEQVAKLSVPRSKLIDWTEE